MPLSMSAAMGDVWTYDASSTTSSLLQIVVDIVVVVVAAPGPNPTKKCQHKFLLCSLYTHSDWMLKSLNQSYSEKCEHG